MRIAMPWLDDIDVPAARAWSQLEILADRAFAYLRALDIVNAKDEPRRLLDELRKLRLAQLGFARELGMTPAARMAIKATGQRAAFDITAALAGDDAERAVEVGESRAVDDGK
ncbi:MAG TPA: hypothetical protein VNF29_05060 [Candidatus Binataceae bacterium]|nr:hypothetical protein [Candidatus Binataceae bacterium]HVA80273.1 hypothetical protein [Candidatus Binataceae bacterium]